MDKKIYYNNLYDYYSDLFTDKQKEYYESYYFEDLSLSEIAENNEVSRKAVHGQIKIVEEKLEYYENILGLYKKSLKMKEILKIGFEKLNLNKIFWCVNPINARAVRFYDKNGYKRVSKKGENIIGYTKEQIDSYFWYEIDKADYIN